MTPIMSVGYLNITDNEKIINNVKLLSVIDTILFIFLCNSINWSLDVYRLIAISIYIYVYIHLIYSLFLMFKYNYINFNTFWYFIPKLLIMILGVLPMVGIGFGSNDYKISQIHLYRVFDERRFLTYYKESLTHWVRVWFHLILLSVFIVALLSKLYLSKMDLKTTTKSKVISVGRSDIVKFQLLHEFYHIDSLLGNWYELQKDTISILSDLKKQEFANVGLISTSKALHQAINTFEGLQLNYKNKENQLNGVINSIKGFSNLFKYSDIFNPKVTLEELNKLKNDLVDTQDQIVNQIETIELELNNQKVFFEPWDKLLDLIQQTQEGIPVNISRIAQLTHCSEENAVGLIKLLLQEHPTIGEFLELEQVYIKKSGVEDAIDKLINEYRSFEESGRGKI